MPALNLPALGEKRSWRLGLAIGWQPEEKGLRAGVAPAARPRCLAESPRPNIDDIGTAQPPAWRPSIDLP